MATHINYLLSLKEKYNLNSLVNLFGGASEFECSKIFEKNIK